jgi:hypothetical protein
MTTSTRNPKQFTMLSWGGGIPGIGYRSALPHLIELSHICLPLLTGLPLTATSEASNAACVSVEGMAFGFAIIRK